MQIKIVSYMECAMGFFLWEGNGRWHERRINATYMLNIYNIAELLLRNEYVTSTIQLKGKTINIKR